jgi:hypothetical protein
LCLDRPRLVDVVVVVARGNVVDAAHQGVPAGQGGSYQRGVVGTTPSFGDFDNNVLGDRQGDPGHGFFVFCLFVGIKLCLGVGHPHFEYHEVRGVFVDHITPAAAAAAADVHYGADIPNPERTTSGITELCILVC